MTKQDLKNTDNPTTTPNNTRVVAMCLGMVFGMGALAYASVPLYQLFCQVTGYGGTTQVAENVDGVQMIDRDIRVRFDANTDARLNWEFKPQQREVNIKMGQKMVINYTAENLSSQPIAGMATFNVTPQAAGAFFNKIECFCFTNTYIEPGETLEMPVVFFVDPDMDKEEVFKALNTITLSYTFYESDEQPEKLTRAGQPKQAGNAGNEKL